MRRMLDFVCHPWLRYALAAVIWTVITASGEQQASAQNDFFRSSPGALSQSHASIDGQEHCNDCHNNGRELSNDKCLGCHDHSDLRARIQAGKGYHASAEVRGKKCESCHIEHKGRSFDIMGWKAVGGIERFNHNLTGWPLKGKHAATECAECHTTRNRQGLRIYLGADPLCGSCHKDDQPHDFDRKAMMACERCHTESVWKPAKPRDKQEFDHNNKQDAAMPLVGSHADVSCAKCHPKAKFNLRQDNPASCGNSGCHASPHDGHIFGTKDCEWCHSPQYKALDKIRFDHGRKTRFELGGKHSQTECYACHTKQLATRKPDKACETCHADDNRHKDRFKEFGNPPKCDTCHPSGSWSPNVFNHNKRTKFELTGKHADTSCRSCHRGKDPASFERFNPKTVGCMGCHAHKKAHNGEFKDKQCLQCHTDPGQVTLTEKSVEIYHGPKSRFPLVKEHKEVECEECHLNGVYKNTPVECGARCHEDWLHKGSLGDTCTNCHSGGEWDAVRFDHSEDTKWPLKGLHKTVPDCSDCHPARQYSKTPTTCSASGCHAEDDVHEGKLGKNCERCHQETGDVTFNHNTQSDYKLDGAHLTTRCSDCHPSITFKPRPMNCFGCHPEPEVHKGQYGTVCETCHTTQSWVDIRALHDVGEFALKGAHDNIPCARCHKDNRPLGGSGNLCINCHRQDDIHSNSLSPRCGECHTQWSFAPARFDHSTVGCNLPGIHRTMPCYDCHKAGNFGGLSPQCVSCHRDIAIAKKGDHLGYTACAQCHNPNTWTYGTPPYGRESICQ